MPAVKATANPHTGPSPVLSIMATECRVVARAISEMARSGYDYIVSEITFHLAQMTSADVVAKVCCVLPSPVTLMMDCAFPESQHGEE